jgi:hypothetical protein
MLLFTIESLSCFDEGFYPMFPSNRDGNFTHRYPTRQVRARVSFFTRGSDPHPPCESAGAGAGFIFHPWVTRGYPKFQILMVLTQSAHLNSRQPQSFVLAQHYPPLKSCTITLGGVHLTHQLHSSLGSSIHRAHVIEFTSTLLKPAGDQKLGRCGLGCDFSPVGVPTGGFGQVLWVWLRAGFCQTCPVAIPT